MGTGGNVGIPSVLEIVLYLLVRAAWVLVPVALGYLSWLAW